jgi:hypothetical protein
VSGDPTPVPAAPARIDLSGERVPSPSQLPPETFHRAADVPERTRRRLAYALTAILAAVVAVALAVLFLEQAVELRRAKDMIGLVLTPIVGLVGSVVGFYFGARTAQEAAPSVPPGG